MKQHRFLLSLLALFVGLAASAKSIRFEIDAGSSDRQDCTVTLDVSAYLKKKSQGALLEGVDADDAE